MGGMGGLAGLTNAAALYTGNTGIHYLLQGDRHECRLNYHRRAARAYLHAPSLYCSSLPRSFWQAASRSYLSLK